MNEEILTCISKTYTTYEEYLKLIEQCDDLQIKQEYPNGGYSGMLHLAISNEKWDVAEDLINRGIDVNMQDENGNTVLHYISSKPINVDIAEKILLAGGNPNIENRWAVTPLYEIVCNNNYHWKEQKYKLLKIFMKYGGDKNHKDSQQGTTPMQMAYEFADAKMIEILEEK